MRTTPKTSKPKRTRSALQLAALERMHGIELTEEEFQTAGTLIAEYDYDLMSAWGTVTPEQGVSPDG